MSEHASQAVLPAKKKNKRKKKKAGKGEGGADGSGAQPEATEKLPKVKLGKEWKVESEGRRFIRVRRQEMTSMGSLSV